MAQTGRVVVHWLPWDPNADKVADEVFQNSQLNDMMEKYQENNVNRDIFYEEQKRDKIKAAQEEVRKAKEEEAAKKALEEKDVSEEYPIDEEPVQEGSDEKVSEAADSGAEVSEAADAGAEVVEEPKKGSEVSDDIKDSLESDDPWMQRKKAE